MAEAQVCHQAGAVVVGIERDEHLLLAPSPYQTFEKNDFVYFVGEGLSYSRMKNLFKLD